MLHVLIILLPSPKTVTRHCMQAILQPTVQSLFLDANLLQDIVAPYLTYLVLLLTTVLYVLLSFSVAAIKPTCAASV